LFASRESLFTEQSFQDEAIQSSMRRARRMLREFVQEIRVRFVGLDSAKRATEDDRRETQHRPVDSDHPVLGSEGLIKMREFDVLVANFSLPHAIKP